MPSDLHDRVAQLSLSSAKLLNEAPSKSWILEIGLAFGHSCWSRCGHCGTLASVLCLLCAILDAD